MPRATWRVADLQARHEPSSRASTAARFAHALSLSYQLRRIQEEPPPESAHKQEETRERRGDTNRGGATRSDNRLRNVPTPATRARFVETVSMDRPRD